MRSYSRELSCQGGHRPVAWGSATQTQQQSLGLWDSLAAPSHHRGILGQKLGLKVCVAMRPAPSDPLTPAETRRS